MFGEALTSKNMLALEYERFGAVADEPGGFEIVMTIETRNKDRIWSLGWSGF